MPKPKTVPKAKQSKAVRSLGLRRLPQHAVIFVIAAVALLIILLALLGYRNQEARKRSDAALAADKATFAQIEADMDATYNGIVAAVGAPTESSFNKFCARPNLKYEEGDLSCNINYSFEYSDTQFNDSAERLNKIKGAISGGPMSIRGTETDSSLSALMRNNTLYVGIENSYNAICVLVLDYSHMEDALFESTYNIKCSKIVSASVY